jgi:CheY-like chemotaxis protein
VEPAAGQDEVVLIVDDDESIRQSLELALQLENHPTALACDGSEALRWLSQHDAPSLILLDLMMPHMDGWQVHEVLSHDERLSRVPVVIITAFDRDLGSVADLPVLKKPIDLDDLLSVVDSYAPPGADGHAR